MTDKKKDLKIKLDGKDELARKNLRAAMIARHFSVADLAAKVEISVSAMNQYHTGESLIRNAKACIVYEMSKNLQVDIECLLGEASYSSMLAGFSRKMSSKQLDESITRAEKYNL